MIQTATVERVFPNRTAEVAAARPSACAHDCGDCTECLFCRGDAVLRVIAEDPIGVSVGDRVVIESESRRVLGITALVYLVPLAAFFAGYFLPKSASPGARCLFGGIGFLLGFLPALLSDRRARRSQAVRYRIKGLAE